MVKTRFRLNRFLIFLHISENNDYKYIYTKKYTLKVFQYRKIKKNDLVSIRVNNVQKKLSKKSHIKIV